MMQWVWVGIYILGYLWSLRTLAGMIAWSEKSCFDEIPQGGDWFFGIFLGGLASFFWPIALATVYGVHMAKRGVPIFYIPREQRLLIRERKEREMEKRIAQLEREVLSR